MLSTRLSTAPLFSALVLCGVASGVQGSTTPPAATSPTQTPPSATSSDAKKDSKPSQEELDQMLAPIALYPDSLLSQILMASTYPLEIVEADRWVKANPKLEGDALTKELEAKSWDPSVKSLVNFPDLLASLSDNLEWTRKIGDAFLADQEAVMAAVQGLRKKAKDAGNLETNDEMKVTTEPASGSQQTIIIESANPQVIYVPAYDPVVVYGTWWYPAYPPPVYYRPPYYRPGGFLTFGVGFAFGAAWGYAWGGCNWRRSHVDIDINRNVNINANIDRSRYRAEFNQSGGRRTEWKHDPSHRKGVAYADNATAQRFEGRSRDDLARSRESFRGRADADRRQLERDRASGRIDSTGREIPGTGSARDRAGAAKDRAGPEARDRAGAARDRAQSIDRSGSSRTQNYSRSSGRAGAFTGSGNGSSSTRSAARGRVSRGRGGR